VGIAAAMYWAAMQSYAVLVPLTDSQKYDVAFDIDGVLKTVQVKTATSKNDYNRFVVYLKTNILKIKKCILSQEK